MITAHSAGGANDPANSGIHFSLATPAPEPVARSRRAPGGEQGRTGDSRRHWGRRRWCPHHPEEVGQGLQRCAHRVEIARGRRRFPYPIPVDYDQRTHAPALTTVVARSPDTNSALYRGSRMYPTDMNALIDAGTAGVEVDLPIGSFSTSRHAISRSCNRPKSNARHDSAKSARVVIAATPGITTSRRPTPAPHSGHVGCRTAR